MDLNLSKDHKIVKETVSKIAQKELFPRASEIDKTHSFVWWAYNLNVIYLLLFVYIFKIV